MHKHFLNAILAAVLFCLPAAAQQPPVTSQQGSGLASQVKGQDTVGLGPNSAGSSPSVVKVSAFCGATAANGYTTCPNYTDESYAIVAAIAASSGSNAHVADDMCGTQTWSEQPFTGSKARGIFEFTSNCQHIIMVDGMSTIEIGTGMFLHGLGSDGTTLSATVMNTVIEAANCAFYPCVNGGFQVQQSASFTTSVTGAVMTITLASGAPFTTTVTSVNHIGPGRLLCINNSGTSNNNGCWVVQSVVSGTAPQSFTVGVVSGTTSACASSCGTVYLDTPLMTTGIDGSGNGTYHSGFDEMSLDCQYVPGCGGFVQAQGEEGTRIGHLQVWNAPAYFGRLDQSAAYGGPASNVGDTNSGPYGPWAGNMRQVDCRLSAGCACTAGPTCSGGLTPNGSPTSCGTHTVADQFSPNFCTNPNWVGFAFTGLAGLQGTDRVAHITTSLSDNGGGGGHPISFFQGSGATTGTGVLVAGSAAQFSHIHTEYSNVGVEVCGNSALNATWEEEYGTTITGGVTIVGGFFGGGGGSPGLDIGQSGNGAYCQDIDLQDADVAAGGVSDNITGQTCSDQVISYKLGHGTTPSVTTTCSTLPNVQTASVKSTTHLDANGNPFIKSSATAGAVDSVTVTNAATANPATVTVGATGSDSNINLSLVGKGTGAVQLDPALQTPPAHSVILGEGPALKAAGVSAVAAGSVLCSNGTSADPIFCGPAYFTVTGFCVGAVTNASVTYYLSPFQSSVTSEACGAATAVSNLHSAVTTRAGLCNLDVSSSTNVTQNLTFTVNDVSQSTSFTSQIAASGGSHLVTNQTLAITAGDAINISFTVVSGETTAANLRANLFCW